MSFFTQPSVGGNSTMPQAHIETVTVQDGEQFLLGWNDRVVLAERSGKYRILTIVRRPN